MNFLAHIFLSGGEEPVVIGNFIGDFVKGNQYTKYDSEVQKGILLHRSIDHFTDHHPVVRSSTKRLQPAYGHYAPVIVDLYYDHFLAALWDTFSNLSLRTFVDGFYQLTESYRHVIPSRALYMLRYMIRDNWLYQYSTIEGIGKALAGLSRRTSFESNMEFAVDELQENYDMFKTEFLKFFPDVRAHSENFLNSIEND